MPIQPGGVSKFDRIDALRKVLSRWGRLNKQQIDQHVSSALNCDSEEIARSLYRDLADLVAKNELTALYFTRDGAPIADYDPDVHKNMYCEWATKEGAVSFVGGAFLKGLGGELVLARRLAEAVSVSGAEVEPARDALNFYF